MCGFAGFVSLNRSTPANELDHIVARMAAPLFHRGPDDGGTWVDGVCGIALSHRRLSILDLSPAGHQPMHSTCGRYVLVFNGEIYNHLELRAELKEIPLDPPFSKGGEVPFVWRGHSDTETLLACFAAWGVRQTLERTVGMFALALWDCAERRLYLSRDRFGEKPLYYGWVQGAFVFGSELKALRHYPDFANTIDRDVIALYLQYCYVPAPYSIYEGIYKLEPGCLLSLTAADAANPPAQALFSPARHGGLTIERYWSLSEVAVAGLANPLTDERAAVDELEKTLTKAVSQQSIADVPLGAFLSGGIDSSTIVALMQAQSNRRVQTFAIGFEEAGFNEAVYAKEVARHLGTDHTELYVSAQQSLDVIPKLPQLYDEPFADSSQIPTHLIAQLARQHVTVALSGDAGDELFGGYNRYIFGKKIWNRLSWLPSTARSRLGTAMQRLPLSSWNAIGAVVPGKHQVVRLGDKAHKLAHRLKNMNSIDDLYRSLVSEWPADSGVVVGAKRLPTRLDGDAVVAGVTESEHRMMLWDSLNYLPDDILCKVDRAAMGVSLETRVPFLDHRVAELAWRLPLGMKIRQGEGKWVLRQVLYRHVPRELIERPKAGFAIPIGLWLRGPLRVWAEALLAPARLKEQGLLNADLITMTWRQHLAGTHDWTPRLWAVLMLQAWLEEVEPSVCKGTGTSKRSQSPREIDV